jgi:hypothetical protein
MFPSWMNPSSLVDYRRFRLTKEKEMSATTTATEKSHLSPTEKDAESKIESKEKKTKLKKSHKRQIRDLVMQRLLEGKVKFYTEDMDFREGTYIHYVIGSDDLLLFPKLGSFVGDLTTVYLKDIRLGKVNIVKA